MTAAARKQVIDEIANGVIADRAAREAETAEREAVAADLLAARKANHKAALKVAGDRAKALDAIDDALCHLSGSLREALACNIELMKLGCSGMASPGFLRRVSKYLAAHLVHASGDPAHFGEVRLHFTGRPTHADSFAESESAALAVALETLKGKINGIEHLTE